MNVGFAALQEAIERNHWHDLEKDVETRHHTLGEWAHHLGRVCERLDLKYRPHRESVLRAWCLIASHCQSWPCSSPHQVLGQDLFRQACMSGFIDLARAMLQSGFLLSITSIFHKNTPLVHLATRNGEHELLQLLLEHGVDANGVDRYGKTALVDAVMNNDVHAMQVLVNAGCDPNKTDNLNSSCLLDAAEEDHVEPQTIVALLDLGASIHQGDKYGTVFDMLDGKMKSNFQATRTRAHAVRQAIDDWMVKWANEVPPVEAGRARPRI